MAGTPSGRAKESSSKRRRDDDSDTSMDEDVQPRPTKQRKTTAIPRTARGKAPQSSQGPSSSSPIRKNGGLRVPPAIESMDLDGFDTSLLNDTPVLNRSQVSTVGSSAGNVRSSGSNTTTTKRAAVVVDLLDSSDDDEPLKRNESIPTPPNDKDPTFDSDLQSTREITIARRRLQNSPRRSDSSQSQNVAHVKPSSSAPPARPKVSQLGGSLPNTRTAPASASQPPARPTQSALTSSSGPAILTPTKPTSASQPPATLTQTPRPVSSTPSKPAPSFPKHSQTPTQISTQTSQPKTSTTDQPSPGELRRRRLARFDQPVNRISQEEINTTMQDLALTPHKTTKSEDNWPLPKLPVNVPSAPPQQQNNEPRTPKRIGGFTLDSSPLFVTPEPERVERGVIIDLTDD